MYIISLYYVNIFHWESSTKLVTYLPRTQGFTDTFGVFVVYGGRRTITDLSFYLVKYPE